MKRICLILVLLLSTLSSVFCQNQKQEIIVEKKQHNKQMPVNDFKWAGTVRFKPAATIMGFFFSGGLEIVADWVPYVSPNIGIPVEFDVGYFGKENIVGFGMMSGIEAVPFRFKEKNGLYLAAMTGFILMRDYVRGLIAGGFTAKADVGYQLVARRGFVFTPAVGVVYNSLSTENSGFGLEIMLDIGFAYKKKAR